MEFIIVFQNEWQGLIQLDPLDKFTRNPIKYRVIQFIAGKWIPRIYGTLGKGVVGRYRKQIPEMFAWKVFTSKINFRNICSMSVCICLPCDFSRSFVNVESCVHLYALREFERKNLQGFWITWIRQFWKCFPIIKFDTYCTKTHKNLLLYIVIARYQVYLEIFNR